MQNNSIKWYEDPALDDPALKSPQPCARGIHCNYMVKNPEGELVRACCKFVHPGEEGTGRRYFPQRAKELGDGEIVIQPAVVRLTGARDLYYSRMFQRLPWSEWCELSGIPYTPCEPGKPYQEVKIVSLGKGRRQQGVKVSSNPCSNCACLAASSCIPAALSERNAAKEPECPQVSMMFAGFLPPREERREGWQWTAAECPLVRTYKQKEDSSDEDMEAID
jgi:hypothetical protein